MNENAYAENMYGLLGKNIEYSLSPIMHNAALKHFGIPGEYKIFDIEENSLVRFFHDLVSGGKVNGFNITVPYKIRIKEMLEGYINRPVSIDAEAKILGSVNTVHVTESCLSAFNTDGKGFYASLVEEANFDPKGKDIFVLGAGGAGKAISIFLALFSPRKPRSVNVYDLDESRLSSIATISYPGYPEGVSSSIIRKSNPDKMKDCHLVINATPLGTKEGDPLPFNIDHLKKRMIVYDLVYARETELIACAKEKGLHAVGGLGMLVNQGALSFNIWTGCPLDEAKKVMRDALEEARRNK